MDDQKQPLISVLIPVYNTRAYLPEALDSVLGQTYKNLDVVLVDDGSTDGSAALCDAYAQKDARVRVIHQPNGGVAAARNRLISEIRGAYVAWVDSDDVCAPNMLAYLYAGIIAYNADIAQVQNTIKAPDFAQTKAGNIRDARVRLLETPEAIAQAFENRDINEWLTLKLFRRSLFAGVVIPVLSIGEDDYTIHMICGQTPRVLLLPEVMYFYRQRDNSLMQKVTPAQLAAYMCAIKPLRAGGKSSLRAFYLDAHNLAIALHRHKAFDMVDDDFVVETFRKARENKHALFNAGFLGILGKMELAALATGKPWSWRFAILCQRLYEIRAKRRLNQ